jgi:hypothetical protein
MPLLRVIAFAIKIQEKISGHPSIGENFRTPINQEEKISGHPSIKYLISADFVENCRAENDGCPEFIS